MEEIRIGMRFKNRANKRIAYVAQIDEVGKCADLMYEAVEEGQSKGARSSLAGLKAQKSWSYIKEEAQQEEPEAVEESTASDGTPFAQVMEEIKQDEAVAVEKKKAEKKQKPAKEKKAPKENWVDPIGIVLNYLNSNNIRYKHNGGKYIGIYSGDSKTACMIVYRRKHAVRVYVGELFDNLKSFENLYVEKGPATKRFDYSIYIDTDNIDKAFEKLLKEV